MAEVQRCEEMERRLRYVERECIRDDVPVDGLRDGENPSAPAPREMSELEAALSNLERDLSDVTGNYVALRKNHLELLELKHLLLRTETFLSETQLQIGGGGGGAGGGDVEEGGESRSELKFNSLCTQTTVDLIPLLKHLSFN